MKILDFNQMVTEEAKLILGDKEYQIREHNLYQWAEYNERLKNIGDNPTNEEVVTFSKWMVKSLIPELDIYTCTESEFQLLIETCTKVFNGGISELGKKMKPLSQLIKVV